MCNKDPVIMTSNTTKQRRMNKPLMERRRRERINKCLYELKSLVLKAQKKEVSRFTKLEKADILEMTLRHLRSVQEEERELRTHGNDVSKYRLGFARCVAEVSTYFRDKDDSSHLGEKLISYLNNALLQISPPTSSKATTEQFSRGGPPKGSLQSGYIGFPQETLACIENRHGCFTISKAVSRLYELNTTIPQDCSRSKGIVTVDASLGEPQGIDREASPPWCPPSPPLNDSVQPKLSLPKTESSIIREYSVLPQFTKRTVSKLVTKTPVTAITSALPLKMPKPLHKCPDSCQEVPLNLVSPRRENTPKIQGINCNPETSPYNLHSRSHPTSSGTEFLNFQASSKPLSPPSSVSSSPEPFPPHEVPGKASDSTHGQRSKADSPSRFASATLDHTNLHWRPW